MTNITHYNNCIEVNGHAGNQVICGMVSVICSGMLHNLIDIYDLDIRYIRGEGIFTMSFDDIPDDKMEVVNAFISVLKQIAHEQPENVTYREVNKNYDQALMSL